MKETPQQIKDAAKGYALGFEEPFRTSLQNAVEYGALHPETERYYRERFEQFTNDVAYNHGYAGAGKWRKKEWPDEPLVDVREYTTGELFVIWTNEQAKINKLKNR